MKQRQVTIALAAGVMLLCSFSSFAQEKTKDVTLYQGGEAYAVKSFPSSFVNKTPKNVILFIGDGMGVSQLFAGLTANRDRKSVV